MTWGGTKKKFREIVTLETGDMPQKVLAIFLLRVRSNNYSKDGCVVFEVYLPGASGSRQ
jgi:hypothetical protein